MEITPKFQYIKGSFDTKEVNLVLVPKQKHGEVLLCVKEPGSGFNLPIGEITLYDSELYVDFEATLDDATKLGEEICRRFNEFPKDKKL